VPGRSALGALPAEGSLEQPAKAGARSTAAQRRWGAGRREGAVVMAGT